MIIIPVIPSVPPINAKKILSGRVFLIPICVNAIWIISVNRILDDAIVDVKEAPILFIPSI